MEQHALVLLEPQHGSPRADDERACVRTCSKAGKKNASVVSSAPQNKSKMNGRVDLPVSGPRERTSWKDSAPGTEVDTLAEEGEGDDETASLPLPPAPPPPPTPAPAPPPGLAPTAGLLRLNIAVGRASRHDGLLPQPSRNKRPQT